VNGTTVGKFNLTRAGNMTTGKFDISALASGLYLVNVHLGNGKTETKVMKQ
jgi:hypothetical protein